jgi:hypothetical protein
MIKNGNVWPVGNEERNVIRRLFLAFVVGKMILTVLDTLLL